MVTLVFLSNFPMNLGSWNLGRVGSNCENKNPNSLKLVPEISGQIEISGSKAELCFGSITRNSRLMKPRRRSPYIPFLEPWGSKIHLASENQVNDCRRGEDNQGKNKGGITDSDHSTVSPSPPNLCISGSMGVTTDQDDSPESLTPPNLGIMGPQAQQQMRNTKRELLKTQIVMIPPSVAEPMDPMILRFGRLRLSGESSRSVVPPIDPMQQRFGGLKVTGESSQSVVPPMDPKIQRFGELGFKGKSSESVIPPLLMDEPKEKRKMFATFSKGHPVSEWELWGYFNKMFGECLATVWSPSLCRW
nr:uncharacterized protein LOC109160696 isoform X2 [Ipomoea trifida]